MNVARQGFYTEAVEKQNAACPDLHSISLTKETDSIPVNLSECLPAVASTSQYFRCFGPTNYAARALFIKKLRRVTPQLSAHRFAGR